MSYILIMLLSLGVGVLCAEEIKVFEKSLREKVLDFIRSLGKGDK